MGCTRIFTVDGGWIALHPKHFEAFKQALADGDQVFSGTNCYGGEMMLVLAHVTGVQLDTPEIIAQMEEDDREDKRQEAFSA